jgi:hypothetical protein
MRAFLLGLCALALTGCTDDRRDRVFDPTPHNPEALKWRVSDRPANTDGVVFIAMYHRVTEKEGSFARSRENFRKDLQRLYDMGFRPVTLGEYIDNKMDLAPGASPVVMTWDDSDPNQMDYLPDGTLDPNCAVALWQAFAKEHPDFPVKGSFYVNANGPFKKDGRKKVRQLHIWGCEVDSHTMTHAYLGRISDDEVKKELGGMQDYLRELGVENPRVMCLPFGMRPKNRELLKSFEWNGKTYTHQAALLVGANPAPSPNDPKRDLFALPRIQAYDGEMGLTYWLDQVEAGKVSPYVQP